MFPEFEGGEQLCPRTGLTWDHAKLKQRTVDLGIDIRGKLDLEIADMGIEGSRFFKTVYKNPARLGAMVRETEVVDSLEG